jgi:hypothetical protein
LPSGQDVAQAMSLPVLTAAELALDGLDLPAAGKAALKAHTPLWYYLLREAQVKGAGEHLGPVGGRIVAEVLLGILANDPLSYFRVEPGWRPQPPFARDDGTFDMPQLIRFALQP